METSSTRTTMRSVLAPIVCQKQVRSGRGHSCQARHQVSARNCAHMSCVSSTVYGTPLGTIVLYHGVGTGHAIAHMLSHEDLDRAGVQYASGHAFWWGPRWQNRQQLCLCGHCMDTMKSMLAPWMTAKTTRRPVSEQCCFACCMGAIALVWMLCRLALLHA